MFEQFLLDLKKDFHIISNFYLDDILSEPNSFTIVTSNKILKMCNYVLILSIFFSWRESGICSVRTLYAKENNLCGLERINVDEESLYEQTSRVSLS